VRLELTKSKQGRKYIIMLEEKCRFDNAESAIEVCYGIQLGIVSQSIDANHDLVAVWL
jgi:hypothetical protein